MRFIFFILLLCINGAALTAQKISVSNLKTGDLLFQNLDCGEMCDAIEAVTKGWKGRSFSHVGVVEKIKDRFYVWESMGAGVRSVPLNSFQQRSSHPLLVGRLKKRYQQLILPAIQFIHEKNGTACDAVFLPDNESYYCSELIYDAFKYAANGKPFFKLYPMTFKQPGSSEYFPVWKKYYQQLQLPVPEGVPGCNPGGLSRSKRVFIVGQF